FAQSTDNPPSIRRSGLRDGSVSVGSMSGWRTQGLVFLTFEGSSRMFRSFARPISGWTGRLAMGALTVAGLMFVWSARAEDEKPAKKGASAAAEKEEDPFALPKDASPAQLLRFIKK